MSDFKNPELLSEDEEFDDVDDDLEIIDDDLNDDELFEDSEDQEETNEENQFVPDIEMLESTGFDIKQNGERQQAIKTTNSHLTKLQKEIFYAIKFADVDKLLDLDAHEQTDINFMIEVQNGIEYSPLQLASVMGDIPCLEALMRNPRVDINSKDKETDVNSFWLASFYGRGAVMGLLAEKGIDIYQKHRENQSNALHVAVERGNLNVVNMLLDSDFPLNDVIQGGLTALIISARDKNLQAISLKLIQAGADINHVTEDGQSALSQAVLVQNQELADYLMKRGGQLFNKELKDRNKSPFYQAITVQSVWAIEMFCDHGADMTVLSEEGMTPQIFAAQLGLHEICLYLCLRSSNINQEYQKDGKNVFVIYMLRNDISRMNQILMRGADINYANAKGKTPLHIAVENRMPASMIKLLMKSGADPHICDLEGYDTCDKVEGIDEYMQLKRFKNRECDANPQLRKHPQDYKIENDKKIRESKKPGDIIKVNAIEVANEDLLILNMMKRKLDQIDSNPSATPVVSTKNIQDNRFLTKGSTKTLTGEQIKLFKAKQYESPDKRNLIKKVANLKFDKKQKDDLNNKIGQIKVKEGFLYPDRDKKVHEELASMLINLELVKTKLPEVKKNMKSKQVQAEIELPPPKIEQQPDILKQPTIQIMSLSDTDIKKEQLYQAFLKKQEDDEIERKELEQKYYSLKAVELEQEKLDEEKKKASRLLNIKIENNKKYKADPAKVEKIQQIAMKAGAIPKREPNKNLKVSDEVKQQITENLKKEGQVNEVDPGKAPNTLDPRKKVYRKYKKISKFQQPEIRENMQFLQKMINENKDPSINNGKENFQKVLKVKKGQEIMNKLKEEEIMKQAQEDFNLNNQSNERKELEKAKQETLEALQNQNQIYEHNNQQIKKLDDRYAVIDQKVEIFNDNQQEHLNQTIQTPQPPLRLKMASQLKNRNKSVGKMKGFSSAFNQENAQHIYIKNLDSLQSNLITQASRNSKLAQNQYNTEKSRESKTKVPNFKGRNSSFQEYIEAQEKSPYLNSQLPYGIAHNSSSTSELKNTFQTYSEDQQIKNTLNKNNIIKNPSWVYSDLMMPHKALAAKNQLQNQNAAGNKASRARHRLDKLRMNDLERGMVEAQSKATRVKPDIKMLLDQQGIPEPKFYDKKFINEEIADTLPINIEIQKKGPLNALNLPMIQEPHNNYSSQLKNDLSKAKNIDQIQEIRGQNAVIRDMNELNNIIRQAQKKMGYLNKQKQGQVLQEHELSNKFGLKRNTFND